MTDHPYFAGLEAAATGQSMVQAVKDHFGTIPVLTRSPDAREFVDGFAGGLVAISQGAFTKEQNR